MKIYIIARSRLDERALAKFLSSEGTSWKRTKGSTQAERVIEIAGRVCYMSFGNRQSSRTNPQYIANLIEMGHESVLEHVSWTFIIADVSRAFTHQLVRHRAGFSFSQLSQQYHDESEADFVEPSLVRRSKTGRVLWRRAMEAARDTYVELIKELSVEETEPITIAPKESLRALRSAARSVLPNATKTSIVVTANARALRTFLRVRGCIVGDEEMRRVSAQLLTHLKVEAPALFADFFIEPLADRTPIVRQSGKITEQ
jgi:thymidylate synthase (FAD)